MRRPILLAFLLLVLPASTSFVSAKGLGHRDHAEVHFSLLDTRDHTALRLILDGHDPLGKCRRTTSKPLRHPTRREHGIACQHNYTGVAVISGAFLAQRQLDFIEQAADSSFETRARMRQLNLTRRAVEKLELDRIFKFAHAAAHCRLRQIERARRASETPLPRDGDKHLELLQ